MLLSYRVPREPSSPRIAIWRKLRQLGVAQLGDGVVALPADARTREQLEWVAEDAVQAGGSAVVWLARPTTAAQERQLAGGMAAARAVEYAAIRQEAEAAAGLADTERASMVRRLRAELRRIGRRDYFPPAERDAAVTAVQALALAREQEQAEERS
ncbi:chromate resistance protein [Actinomadura graeca]|uniref:Chromate resistance protein n=1 Tax=Actinomadura graeca TaxID=2750812 RepID=A0ABX8R6I5_9ACTN|nr:chromate resistance protein [Actinomadura graeca]